jgi:hypothetical protein
MPLRDHFRPPLEDSRPWDELHGAWPTVIVMALNLMLPPRYVAVPRVHLEPSDEYEVRVYDTQRHRRYSRVSTKAAPGRSVIGVPLQRPPRPLRFRRALRGVTRRSLGHVSAAGLQQGVHHLAPIQDRPAQLATSSFPGPDHLAQRDGLASQLLADRPADEPVLVEDPDLRDVARVVPQQDILGYGNDSRQNGP